MTFTVINLAPSRQRLENDVFTVSGIAQKYNCALKRLDWQQEQGFVSSLVLGYNGIEIQRGMTTSSTAIFIPFMTRELRMDGQALYYGMNALSHNVIMADRKKLKSANGMYLGSTGSGKSFAAKRELINVFLATSDRIVVVDPMGEYAPLVRRLGGQVIEIAPDSPNHINPMDIQLSTNDEDSPLSMKADFLLSLCELIVGGKEGLQPIEKTVIDRCVRLVYRELALGIGSGDMPLLQDLYEELLKQPEPEARRVATALELYCTGSLNLFNHVRSTRAENEEEYGLLSRYATHTDSYGDVAFNVHSLELWSAHLGEDEGWIWVYYSSETFNHDGSSARGSWRIPSLWKVEKNDTGEWVVVQIREHP